MSEQSDTPRTDKNKVRAGELYENHEVVSTKFARQLKRELTEAKRQLADQTASHAVTVGHCHDTIESLSCWRDMARKLAKIVEQASAEGINSCASAMAKSLQNEHQHAATCYLHIVLAEFNALNDTKS